MKFKYDILKDYNKISKSICEYDLRKECLEKIKELGINRVGTLMASSEFALDIYGKNASWVKEARSYFIEKLGNLDIWVVIEYANTTEDDDDNQFEMFEEIDEDDPQEILKSIILGVFDECLVKYELKNQGKLSLTNLKL